MQNLFLEKNPFYILEVSPYDKRANIISKAEEKAFFTDSDNCEEAQARLLHPEKRLSAELDWFYNISKDEISRIHNCISAKKEISTDGLKNISKLNATLHNFAITNFEDCSELECAILDIDRQFTCIDMTSLVSTINGCHQQAGMREISQEELEKEINRKREQIRQIITNKISFLDSTDYIQFVTLIAEKYLADESYNDGIVILDVIDQYEIKMKSAIDEASEVIFFHIERIKGLASDDEIDSNITDLINRIKEWDVLVQPLQLKSMVSGVIHRDSQEVGGAIRELSLWLHNEKHLSELALRLVQATKSVFAELLDLSDALELDSNTLINIIRDNKETEQVIAEIDSLKEHAEKLKKSAISMDIDVFINRVNDMNQKIKNISIDEKLIIELRTIVYFITRDVMIFLHNEKLQTDYALKIAIALKAEFGDLASISQKLTQDVSALMEQAMLKNRSRIERETQEEKDKIKNIGCLIVLGIIILIWIISNLSQCSSSTSSDDSTSSSSEYSSYSDDMATIEPEEEIETLFSQDSEDYDKVYVDISSIEPAIGIGFSEDFNTDVACECKTADGESVWVYMSITEYNEYIDSSADISVSELAKFETVYYSPAKRIKGIAKQAEMLCKGLSADTGAMVLEFKSIE